MKKIIQHHLGWLLLPVYFILHGWQYYAEILSLTDVAEASAIVILVMCFVWLCSFLLFKTKEKRSLFTFVTGFFLLFTTAFMSAINGRRFLPKLEQQLFCILLLLFLLVVLLRFVKNIHPFINQFINTFLSILIVISIGQLLFNLFAKAKQKPEEVAGFPRQGLVIQKKPSVFLVVLDEYAGSETLLSNFSYSNKSFLDFLESRKFKVIKSAVSNYNYTLLSVPSMFDRTFVAADSAVSVYGKEGSKNGLLKMYYNHSFSIFKEQGYIIKNYSPFVVKDYPAAYSNRFLPGGRLLLLYPSLLDDFFEQVPDYMLTKFGSKKMIEAYHYRKNTNEMQLMDKVLKDARQIEVKPVFCYLHLMLPHAPYRWDSTGNINTGYLSVRQPSPKAQREAYLEQLIHTNKVISAFTDSLMKITANQSVIILMSDHGYKGVSSGKLKDKFNTLNAVYLPEGIQHNWYNGMSNINQFRLLFSTLTQQPLVLEKDSLIY